MGFKGLLQDILSSFPIRAELLTTQGCAISGFVCLISEISRVQLLSSLWTTYSTAALPVPWSETSVNLPSCNFAFELCFSLCSWDKFGFVIGFFPSWLFQDLSSRAAVCSQSVNTDVGSLCSRCAVFYFLLVPFCWPSPLVYQGSFELYIISILPFASLVLYWFAVDVFCFFLWFAEKYFRH